MTIRNAVRIVTGKIVGWIFDIVLNVLYSPQRNWNVYTQYIFLQHDFNKDCLI